MCCFSLWGLGWDNTLVWLRDTQAPQTLRCLSVPRRFTRQLRKPLTQRMKTKETKGKKHPGVITDHARREGKNNQVKTYSILREMRENFAPVKCEWDAGKKKKKENSENKSTQKVLRNFKTSVKNSRIKLWKAFRILELKMRDFWSSCCGSTGQEPD